MWKLSVHLLLCAVMALTAAAPAEGEHAVVKRCAKSSSCTEWNGSCYIFQAAKTTWADAEKACLSKGGHLASIHNKGEHKAIQNLIRTKTGAMTKAWIGGYDVTGTNGAWMWSDGRLMGFTDWGRGEPNNWKGGKQNCMVMNWSGQHLWDDEYCHYKFGSVCKKLSA